MKEDLQQEALSEARSLLEFYPKSFVLYARLNQFFLDHGGPETSCREWHSVLEANPSLECGRIYLDSVCPQAPTSSPDAVGAATGTSE